MPASWSIRLKEEASGKSPAELALVAVTALVLAGGFLYLGVRIP